MSFKDVLKEETQQLQSIKRPYESAAFLLFALLVVQQLAWLIKNLIDFLGPQTWFSTANFCNANLQAWVPRIINVDSTSWLWVALGIVAWLGYYFLLYLFVWSYSQKHGLAKWTWTLFVAFGPTIFLAPPFIWFAIYAFRPYIFRFIKKGVAEFKAFDPNQVFEEELPEEPAPAPEPKPEEAPVE